MTIALIDDDEAALHSLALFLRGRRMAVRCFGSAEAFLAGLEREPPACVVSDVRMPGMSGLELQRELKRRGNPAPVILLTGHGDIAMAVAAMRAGAFDFLEKPYDAEQLIGSIGRSLEAGRGLPPAGEPPEALTARVAELPPRQRQVLDLVTEGLSSKQIAQRLGLSPRTVDNYRAFLMERLGASNVADLVRKVMLATRA